MNRTGLTITLVIGLVAGLICAVDPQLDLDLTRLAFDPVRQMFEINAQPWVKHTREAARVIITLLVLPGFLAVIGKLIFPHRRMLIEGRAAIFLIATLALGPGVLANLILKNHWDRPRPIDVQQFGGTEHFIPWWDPRGDCPDNCSFIAGEPSGAFWTLAPAALAPPELRVATYGAALAFGAGMGVLRMGAGAHFFSDVVFAGVFMYLLIFAAHGLIYRWPATRLSEERIERLLTRSGEALREMLTKLGAKRPL
jgi:membrane-associated PAP2 superfamily phosphatase